MKLFQQLKYKSKMMVPRAGFEHATTRSSAERSPRLSYLGTESWDTTSRIWYGVLKFSGASAGLPIPKKKMSKGSCAIIFYLKKTELSAPS
jgi:hypothetical protein